LLQLQISKVNNVVSLCFDTMVFDSQIRDTSTLVPIYKVYGTHGLDCERGHSRFLQPVGALQLGQKVNNSLYIDIDQQR
jgi:hypothetical protein